MKKGIFVSIIIILIISLSLNFIFWNLYKSVNQKKNCYVLGGEFHLMDDIERIEKENKIQEFNYEIDENDEVKVYLYEYKKDGIGDVFSSKEQLNYVSEGLKSDIEELLTKLNGKNATPGILYGPVYTVKIEIESSDYEADIMLGEIFMTVDLRHNGNQEVFTIRNELNSDIEELINNIKNE